MRRIGFDAGFRGGVALALVLAVAGCETASTSMAAPEAGPAWLSIVDRNLTNGDLTVTLHSDGRVLGSGIEGVWEERDGRYCRTLTLPERLAGTECQTVTLVGDQVTFENDTGRSSTWSVQ